jgi:hypothetical protein
MVRLVEQDAGISPRALLVAPVRVLGWDDGIDIRSDLRIAEHGHGVPDGFQQIFQALAAHFFRSSSLHAVVVRLAGPVKGGQKF